MGDDRPVRQDQFDKLSDKIDNLTEAISAIHVEMEHTRGIIRDYNGLREKIESQGKDILVLKTNKSEKEKVRAHWRELGSWAAAIVALMLYLSQVFHW